MTPQRVSTSIPVEFKSGEVEGSGVIRNLGMGGLFVGSRAIPEHGEMVSLRFSLPGEGRVSLTGLVWWTTRDEPQGRRHPHAGFGLRLLDQGEAYETAVGKLLR